jgi:hypothetical protein
MTLTDMTEIFRVFIGHLRQMLGYLKVAHSYLSLIPSVSPYTVILSYHLAIITNTIDAGLLNNCTHSSL